MSRRVLRKLQGNTSLADELQKLNASIINCRDVDSLDGDSSDPGDDLNRGGRNANPFDALNDDRTPSDNEAKEDDDLDDVKDGEHDSSVAIGDDDDNVNMASQQTVVTDSLKRKKKKRKKKPKEVKEAKADDDEDVETAVQEVKAMLGAIEKDTGFSGRSPPSRHGSNQASSSFQNRGIFCIDYRNLVSENELRKIFGSRVIQAHTGPGKRRSHSRAHVKTCKLVTPKQTWPPLGKLGLTMKLIETKDGIHYFKFEHNAHYQQIQYQFIEAVESMDPSNIAMLLDMHVYHIDALLQLSDIVRLGEEMQMAVDLIERALYCFEMNFHALFNVAQGNCRLDYRYDENRPFYVALFKHLTFVGQRGCHRTALEFCKVLLSLSPDEDPLGVLLMIDLHALKAGEYAYLLSFYDSLEVSRNLSQLPNFAFSVALALFHLATSRLEADESLQSALLTFPGLLLPLLDKCGVQADSRVLSHDFFSSNNCQPSHPPALCTLIQLYVGRCWHLWKEPEVLSWLENEVKVVLNRVDDGDSIASRQAEKRKVRYQGMPRNIYRHIILSEIKDATTNLPPDMAASSVLSFDPLPPTDSISSYTKPDRPKTESGHSFFHVLLHSFFPQYSIQEAAATQQQRPRQPAVENDAVPIGVGGAIAARQQAPAPVEAGAVGGADGAGTGDDMQAFRNSVTQVLDAMRDLLSNFQVADVELDGEVADDSGSGSDGENINRH